MSSSYADQEEEARKTADAIRASLEYIQKDATDKEQSHADTVVELQLQLEAAHAKITRLHGGASMLAGASDVSNAELQHQLQVLRDAKTDADNTIQKLRQLLEIAKANAASNAVHREQMTKGKHDAERDVEALRRERDALQARYKALAEGRAKLEDKIELEVGMSTREREAYVKRMDALQRERDMELAAAAGLREQFAAMNAELQITRADTTNALLTKRDFDDMRKRMAEMEQRQSRGLARVACAIVDDVKQAMAASNAKRAVRHGLERR